MMNAYNESYLDDAACNLAEFMDYMVNDIETDIDTAFEWFAFSKTGEHFENGNPTYIAGMSGVELARHMLFELKGQWIEVEYTGDLDRTIEYWTGWAIAHYQWRCGRRFRDLIKAGLTGRRVSDMYIMHEADITKFYAAADNIIGRASGESRLRRLRAYYGYTQKQLSQKSGVSLRMIQLYEQGQNDLSRAQAGVVISLARTLGCEPQDLL